MRFGEKLRKLRKDSHLTQAELAKRAGLGLKTITNYEKGTTYPQDRRVYGVLAEILGTSADYLHNENDDFVSMAYEANMFAAQVALPDEEILEYIMRGCDVAQIAQLMHSDINLVALKTAELNRQGRRFRQPEHRCDFLK